MRAALRLSRQWGGGDIHWFERLAREDQALVLAFDRFEADPKTHGDAPSTRDPHAVIRAALERAAHKRGAV